MSDDLGVAQARVELAERLVDEEAPVADELGEQPALGRSVVGPTAMACSLVSSSLA